MSHLRFVLATGKSEAEITLASLALEGAKQIRPGPFGPVGSVAAHFAIGKHSRG